MQFPVADRESVARSWPARAEPAMDATMKQAKIMPWGICSPWGLRAGVQRNTKVYMEPSNRDCIAPSSATLRSAHKQGLSMPLCMRHRSQVSPGSVPEACGTQARASKLPGCALLVQRHSG